MRFPTSRPLGRLTAALALAGTIGLSGGAAMAQDATPVGTPIGPDAASCVAPAAAPSASPAAAMASPVATEPAEGTVVEDEAVIAEATAAVENLYACYNAGDGAAFVALFTPDGLATAFPGEDPAALGDHITAKSAQAQAGAVTVNEVVDFGDGSFGVDYQVAIGMQVVHVTDTLTDADGTWLVDGRAGETPETDLDSTTAGVKTSLADGSVVIEIAPSPLSNQEAVKLQVTNGGDSAQHVAIFQGGDATTVTAIDLANLPEGVTFVGEAYVEPGAIVDTLFEGLPEGNYVVVVETANGESGALDLTIDPPFDPSA